ncbi:MAG: AbrB/MazE/SpoVT family DNA-binding domain-containing protein [Nanoarchaeota archaeon]|nr:AbrB/MazE/SpoVT family DNA-binding domain-containing protein [Nanoarchaeota archaeon]MBU1501526.1 AbrB/MazE/SpoVT family DNA-binding domain-containing protein [Nanoarchaeota archaeon]
MAEKCVLCDGKLEKKNVNYNIYGKSIGKFPASVCDSCGEQWFDEDISKKIQEKERKLGLFGLSRETKISYSGNSLIIRIPKELAKFMNLKKETAVVIYPEDKDKIGVSIK